MIKLVVSDLDDTLIHKDLHLPETVIEIVKELRKKGVWFTFATGRMPYRAFAFAKDISLDIPFVANNGSILYCGGEHVYEKKFRASLLRSTIQKYMEDPQFTVLFSYTDRERPLRTTDWIKAREQKYPGYNEPLGCEDAVWEQDVHKIYVVDESRSGSVGQLAAEMKAMQDTVSCFQYGEFSMEIVADGCSKATGVKRLMEYMNCAADEVMAIGDHTNDIEIVQMVGLGIAVANAVPELKAVADEVMSGERSEGVIEAIQKYIFGGN